MPSKTAAVVTGEMKESSEEPTGGWAVPPSGTAGSGAVSTVPSEVATSGPAGSEDSGAPSVTAVPVVLSLLGWACSSLWAPGAAAAAGATTSSSSVLPRSLFISFAVVLLERACGAVSFAAA